jgi:hypothetical protein
MKGFSDESILPSAQSRRAFLSGVAGVLAASGIPATAQAS